MNNLTLILPDNTVIPIEDGSLSGAVLVLFDTKEDLMEAWSHMTPDNLTTVKIARDDGTVLHTMHGVSLDGIQTVVNPDGTLTAHFYMHETVTGNITTDAEYIQAAKILLGEER